MGWGRAPISAPPTIAPNSSEHRTNRTHAVKVTSCVQLVRGSGEFGAIVRGAEIGARPQPIGNNRHVFIQPAEQLLTVTVVDVHNRHRFGLLFLTAEFSEQP